MNANDFNTLDPQSPICALAHVASHEVNETPEYDPDAGSLGNDVSEFDGEPDPEADADCEGWPHNDHTGQSDGEALASAGHGTDEDYGYFGCCDGE